MSLYEEQSQVCVACQEATSSNNIIALLLISMVTFAVGFLLGALI